MKEPTAKWIALAIIGAIALGIGVAQAQDASRPTVLQIKADDVTANVSPMLYGLMTEEINYSYDGGLYAELIRNRIFKEVPQIRRGGRRGQAAEPQPDDPRQDGLAFWEIVQTDGAAATMEQDTTQPMNEALTNSLKLTVSSLGNGHAGVSNEGFWGIPVRPNTPYTATIWAKGADGFTGPLTLAIVSNDGQTVYGTAIIPTITDSYQKYEAIINVGDVPVSVDNRFHVWAGDTGTVWFSLVSLFPPTYNNRPNGNRVDIMKLLVDMKPSFLRFPGGNYLEGQTIETRFDWKKTIGDISERPGHPCDAWGYWSSDGMGLLEFLCWCEDMGAEPVIGIYAGYSLRRVWVEAGEPLKPYVQDALDEIEYAIGDTSTTWGALRAAHGHPEPFKVTYVEIGNEEFSAEASGYYQRFAEFYDAIKAKYPQIKVIAAIGHPSREIPQVRIPDAYDDHFYRDSLAMQTDTHHYDDFDRNGPKIFVGEWATREGTPTPNMGAALSDAAWMTGMERNSDVVVMEAYAPLFVNVNPGGMQWTTDLIGYNTIDSYGSPAYWAQQMFSTHHGNTVVAVDTLNLPMRQMEQHRRGRGARGGRGGRAGGAAAEEAVTMIDVPGLFYNVTRCTETGMVFVKVVNPGADARQVRIQIAGVGTVEPSGQLVQLVGEGTEDTNSIDDPDNIVPATTIVDGLSKDFTKTFPPYSISILKIKTN